MKYIKQLAIISFMAFIGEVLSAALPIPVPGSVYGMLLLFFCLWFKIIKLDWVEETADYLLLIMPIFFVSPGVGILEIYPVIKDSLPALVFISFVTAVLVLVVTGLSAQFLIRLRDRKKKGGEEV